MKYLIYLYLIIYSINVLAVADPFLPEEVCKEAGAPSLECTENNLNALYADLDHDGTKELIVYYGGGSCGAQYYIFRINNKIKWEVIGNWCGCDHGKPKVKTTKHNGYRDIYTCGESGMFNGKKYIGIRQ